MFPCVPENGLGKKCLQMADTKPAKGVESSNPRHRENEKRYPGFGERDTGHSNAHRGRRARFKSEVSKAERRNSRDMEESLHKKNLHSSTQVSTQQAFPQDFLSCGCKSPSRSCNSSSPPRLEIRKHHLQSIQKISMAEQKAEVMASSAELPDELFECRVDEVLHMRMRHGFLLLPWWPCAGYA